MCVCMCVCVCTLIQSWPDYQRHFENVDVCYLDKYNEIRRKGVFQPLNNSVCVCVYVCVCSLSLYLSHTHTLTHTTPHTHTHTTAHTRIVQINSFILLLKMVIILYIICMYVCMYVCVCVCVCVYRVSHFLTAVIRLPFESQPKSLSPYIRCVCVCVVCVCAWYVCMCV